MEFTLFDILNIETGDPPAGWGVRRTISNKECRTAEVLEKNKKIFFTSIFYGSLFCGSAVHILNDPIAARCILPAASCFTHGCWHTFQSIVKKVCNLWQRFSPPASPVRHRLRLRRLSGGLAPARLALLAWRARWRSGSREFFRWSALHIG